MASLERGALNAPMTRERKANQQRIAAFASLGGQALRGKPQTAEARAVRSAAAHRRWGSTAESRKAKREAAWIARRRKVKATPIDKLEVYERDGWQCQLCGGAVDPQLKGSSDRLAPSLDHIVPLALGGEHVIDNVQLAHLGCNSRKGARAA